MDRECPGCARGLDEAARACDFCGYEFRPEPAVEAPRPRTRWFSAVVNMAFGLMVLGAGAHFLSGYDLRSLAGAAAARAPLAQPLEAKAPVDRTGYHKVERTNRGGPESFRITGRVFDLLSLEDVGGATLVFHDRARDKFYGAFAGPDGRYEAYLPETGGGYYLSAHQPGYERGFIEDWEPSLRVVHVEARLEMAADARKHPGELHIYAQRQHTLERDFALVPRADHHPKKYRALN